MDIKTVERVATLSRLKMTREEAEKIAPQLSDILSWVEMLSNVDTDNVEPLANVVDIPLKLRKDEVNDGAIADKVLANAPEETGGFYVVPKIVEQDG